MMRLHPASPITNQDIVKAQTDTEAVLEKYWPGASKVLLEQDLKLSPNCFWPAVNINHARRVLGWEPEQTFEKWLREQGWEDDSH